MQPVSSHRTLALGILLLLTAGASEATLPGQQEERRDFFVLDDLYQRILTRWAQEGPDTMNTVEAVETLLDLTRLETDLQWRAECLDALLENTVRHLSLEDAAALPALAVLYREAYRQLFEELELRPAGGAAERLVRIATAISDSPDRSGGGPDFAIALLTHTAFLAVSHRYPQPLLHARTLLDRAVEIGEPDHPDTPTARVWLAFVEEIEGRPRRVVRRLERLLEDARGDPEVRLRLALNLLRVGREEEGELHLRSLVDEPPDVWNDPSRSSSGWVRIVAIEELGRLLAGRGEREAAATLLRHELEMRPGEQGLATLLASLQPRWSASVSILRGMLAHRTGDRGPSPRWRYEQGPIDRLSGMPERLEREWRASRPAFDRALTSYPHFDELRFRRMRQNLGERPAGRLVIACQGTLGPRARRPVGDGSGASERTPSTDPEGPTP